MDAKFSQRIKDVLSYSKEEAIRLGNDHLAVEHLFLGLIRDGEGIAIDILLMLGAELYDLRKSVEDQVKKDEISSITDSDNLPLYKSTERVLKLVYLEARALKDSMIDTGHLLLAILKDENNQATQVLNEKNIFYENVRKELETDNIENKADFPGDEDDEAKGPF
ncbi:MAG: Clp protease N-terminal domain-containing protein, partial [Bacteroidales bacterium]